MSLVELARFANNAEAHIVRTRLESEGLHPILFDTGMNIAESVGLMIPVRLMVLPDEYDEARAILVGSGVLDPPGDGSGAKP